MKSIHFLLLCTIIFCFSEGKPCPEQTRSHKSRCDIFYKCTILPSGKYVWVPIKCDVGLVYEKNIKACVLPGDDWECEIEDDYNSNPSPELRNDEDNNFDSLILLKNLTGDKNKDLLQVIESVNKNSINSTSIENIELGSGDNEMDLIESKHTFDKNIFSTTTNQPPPSTLLIPSPTSPSKVDSKLISHLQRLSQLIDGLKQKYRTQRNISSDMQPSNNELRPDQLNAFLAHFNIKSGFDAIQPINYNDGNEIIVDKENKLKISENGKIEPEIIKKVVKEQEILNSTTESTALNNTFSTTNSLHKDKFKITQINEIPKRKKKIKIPPKRYRRPLDNGILTKDSFLFNVVDSTQNEPIIPEDTLQTIFKLSKEMASNQNTRHVITLNKLFKPQLHQAYYSLPITGIIHNFPRQKAKYENIMYDDKEENNFWDLQTTTSNPLLGHQENLIDSYGNKITSSEEYIHYPPYKNVRQTTSTTTTQKPILPPAENYFTPNPHLDDSNVNQFIQIDPYPTASYIPTPTANEIQRRHDHQHIYSKYRDPSIIYDENQPDYDIFNRNQHLPIPTPTAFYVNPATVSIEPHSYKKPNSIYEKIQQPQSDEYFDNKINKQSQLQNNFVSNLLALSSNLDHQHKNTHQQFINIGGNFIDYDVFKNHILSLSSHSDGQLNLPLNLEIINCNGGSRQPNATDCTKYYVCSRNNGRVLTYSCPPYTAFNIQSRICDSQTYTICNPYSSTVFNDLALKALQETKRIRNELIQKQTFADLIRLEAQKVLNATLNAALLHQHNNNKLNEGNKMKIISHKYQIKPGIKTTITTTTTESSIILQNDEIDDSSSQETSPISTNTIKKPTNIVNHQRKRIYYCKEGAKIPDQLSVLNYYVCYKTKDGKMHGHKMTCSSGLIFCAKFSMCTLAKKCNL